MPHAEVVTSDPRPATGESAGASNPATTGTVFREVKSKFHGFGRSNSRSRKANANTVPAPTALKAQALSLPAIDTSEFMPKGALRRRVEQMRKGNADLRVAIQILEKQERQTATLREAIQVRLRYIEEHGEEEDGDDDALARGDGVANTKYDMWSKRLSRRRPEHAQLFSTRTAKRPVSRRSESEGEWEDDTYDEASVYSQAEDGEVVGGPSESQ